MDQLLHLLHLPHFCVTFVDDLCVSKFVQTNMKSHKSPSCSSLVVIERRPSGSLLSQTPEQTPSTLWYPFVQITFAAKSHNAVVPGDSYDSLPHCGALSVGNPRGTRSALDSDYVHSSVVYLGHRGQGLGGGLLLFRLLLCPLQDVLQRQATTFYSCTRTKRHRDTFFPSKTQTKS